MPCSGWPNTFTVPVLGASRPAATLSSVLLPQPVGPTTLTNSPAPTVSVTCCTAVYRWPGSSLLMKVQDTPCRSIAGLLTSALRVLCVGLLGEAVGVDGVQIELGGGQLVVDARERAEG